MVSQNKLQMHTSLSFVVEPSATAGLPEWHKNRLNLDDFAQVCRQKRQVHEGESYEKDIDQFDCLKFQSIDLDLNHFGEDTSSKPSMFAPVKIQLPQQKHAGTRLTAIIWAQGSKATSYQWDYTHRCSPGTSSTSHTCQKKGPSRRQTPS